MVWALGWTQPLALGRRVGSSNFRPGSSSGSQPEGHRFESYPRNQDFIVISGRWPGFSELFHSLRAVTKTFEKKPLFANRLALFRARFETAPINSMAQNWHKTAKKQRVKTRFARRRFGSCESRSTAMRGRRFS